MAGNHIMRTVLLHIITHVMKVTKATQQGWQQLSLLSGICGITSGAMALCSCTPVLALHLLVLCLPCIAAHTGNQAEP